MAQPALEVADILRDHGPAWREANRGHVSLDQLKVMGAIERCRTAALGGHVARCENAACGRTEIAYNSCLMGKFRNGELAAPLSDAKPTSDAFYSPLRFCFEQSKELVRWSEDSFAQVRRNDSLDGFRTAAMQISVVLVVESTNRRSEYPVPPKSRSRKRLLRWAPL
jgi:hypothetical protein